MFNNEFSTLTYLRSKIHYHAENMNKFFSPLAHIHVGAEIIGRGVDTHLPFPLPPQPIKVQQGARQLRVNDFNIEIMKELQTDFLFTTLNFDI